MWRYLNFQCELALQMISKYVPIKITEMLFCFRLVLAIQSGIMYISISTAAACVSLAPAAAFIADIVRRFIALNVHPIVTYSGEWKKRWLQQRRFARHFTPQDTCQSLTKPNIEAIKKKPLRSAAPNRKSQSAGIVRWCSRQNVRASHGYPIGGTFVFPLNWRRTQIMYLCKLIMALDLHF